MEVRRFLARLTVRTTLRPCIHCANSLVGWAVEG